MPLLGCNLFALSWTVFQFYSFSSLQNTLSAVCPGLQVERGGSGVPCPPRIQGPVEFKVERGGGWFQTSVLSVTVITADIYRVCCPSISVRTFPSSSHLTLIAIALLYWCENEGTEGLVICSEDKIAGQRGGQDLAAPPTYVSVSQAWHWRHMRGLEESREIFDYVVCWAAQRGALISTPEKYDKRPLFFSDAALGQPPTCHLTDSSKNWSRHWNTAKITSELTLDYSLLWHKFLQITGNQQNQVSNDALKISI